MGKDTLWLSRRRALKVLAGSAGAAAFPILNNARPLVRPQAAAPLKLEAGKFFSSEQIRTIDALAETIIPADQHSPGARAARVYAYIDTLVADSDPAQKTFWTDGLAAIDKAAEGAFGKKYADCSSEQQITLLQKFSQTEAHPGTLEERFFGTIKGATLDGYYTSEIGIHQELEYQGNTALPDFEGCLHDEHRKL